MVSPAVDYRLPIVIADEPRVASDQGPVRQCRGHLTEVVPFAAVGGSGSPVPRQAGRHVPHDGQPNLGVVALLAAPLLCPCPPRRELPPLATLRTQRLPRR